MSLFSGFTVPRSIKWSLIGSLTSNKWHVTWHIEDYNELLQHWNACQLFLYSAPCLDFSHLSLRCRYSMSPRRRWFSVARITATDLFFPRQEKCWRIEVFGATFIDQIWLTESQSSSLLPRLSSYLLPRCLVVLEFWLLLNEQVYCNALVDTIHVHMKRHTLSLPIHWHIFALTYIRFAFTLICACVCLCHVSIDVLI